MRLAGEPACGNLAKPGQGVRAVTFGCTTKAASQGSETPPTISNLLSQAETTDQFVVAIDLDALQIIQQAAALADQLEQAAARVIVFLMRLEMIGEFVDALGQERHLNFRRTGIRSVCLVLRNNVQFSFFC